MRNCLFWCTTLLLLCHPQLHSQTVTTEFPHPPAPPPAPQTSSQAAPPAALPDSLPAALPDDPSRQSTLPEAHLVPPPPTGVPVRLESDTQTYRQTPQGNEYTLIGHAIIHYRDYIVHADHAVYNDATGLVTAQGHMMIDGGPDDEHFEATHGTVNVQTDVGDFFDVAGTLGVRRNTRGRVVLTTTNPYVLTGREVRQLGKGSYRVFHGSMTSCRLPDPDWRILSQNISLDNGQAKASNAFFELLHMPIVYLPYVTHPVADRRDTGILIPAFGSDTQRGTILGEAVYLTLGRSADLTIGSYWYSSRGFAPNGLFRYKGLGKNFATVRFESLLDEGVLLPNGTRGANQGGVDLNLDGRYDFSPQTRAVSDIEYLSSYIYRLTFEENYAVAIDSEVKSQAFLTHTQDGYSESLHVNRYQNFEGTTPPADEVRILHMPEIDVDGIDRAIPGTPLYGGYAGSAAALSRYDFPSFRTTAEVPRVDFYPHLVLPLHFDGASLRSQAAIRDTWYGKSQYYATLDEFPTVRTAGLVRADFEGGVDFRPPAMERDFSAPWLRHLFGGDLRHTVEPDIQYNYVTGIDNFHRILRFDDVDVASDTNELEYSLTQHLYLRHLHMRPCKGDEALGPDKLCGGGTLDWLSWTVAQKHFFDPSFGHALTLGTPNPLLTTLDLTGVDFLTGPRDYSPVISRLRLRSITGQDAEWDLDYDTKAGHITSSNVYAGYQHGLYRFEFGDFYLNSPIGYSPGTAPPLTSGSNAGYGAVATAYNQVHLTAIYGSETKLGLSAGATAAYDLVHQQLQYGAVQSNYNWDCCGLSLEVRRFSLGGIRDDTEYLYSFTLAGFGSTDKTRSGHVY